LSKPFARKAQARPGANAFPTFIQAGLEPFGTEKKLMCQSHTSV